jgi:hypothetical protein
VWPGGAPPDEGGGHETVLDWARPGQDTLAKASVAQSGNEEDE